MSLTEQCLQVKLHLSVRITVPRIGSLVWNRIVRIPNAARYRKVDVFIGFRWPLLLGVPFWQTILLIRNVILLYHGDCWLQVIKREIQTGFILLCQIPLFLWIDVTPPERWMFRLLFRSKSSDPVLSFHSTAHFFDRIPDLTLGRGQIKKLFWKFLSSHFSFQGTID